MDKDEFLQRYAAGERDFSNLDLRKIHLNGDDYSETNLSGCNFTGSDLRTANLQFSNLSNVNFTDAKLEWASFHAAKINSTTIISSKWLLVWQFVENYETDDSGRFILSYILNFKNKTRKDFRFVDFAQANLYNTDLSEVDFTGANFYHAYLESVDFSKSNLSGANLKKAILNQVNLKGSIIDEKTQLDDKWRLVWELVNQGGKNKNLEAIDLSHAKLSDTDLSGINLRYANLTNTYFSNCNLTDADLRGANLTATCFRNSNLNDAILINANIEKTWFYSVNFKGTLFSEDSKLEQKTKLIWQIINQRQEKIDFSNLDLTKVDITKVDLSGCNFSKRNLINVNFRCANLTGANFYKSQLKSYIYYDFLEELMPAADLTGANLTNANFIQADLSHVSLIGANLTNANFTGANLSNADLSGADLRGANLTNAKLNYVNLKATLIDESTKIDAKWLLIWQLVNTEYPKKINLKGADLSYVKLSYMDLSGCNLTDVNLLEAKLDNCDFSDAIFQGANLEKARFEETNLTGANLRDCTCTQIQILNNTNLTNADLSNSNLENAALLGKLSSAKLVNCNLKSAGLYKANLKDANLTNANLTNAALSGANLKNANFTDANLNGAQLAGTKLKNTNFTNANLENVEFEFTSEYVNFAKYYECEDIDIEDEIEKAIICNTNLKGTIFENKFKQKKTAIPQEYDLLKTLQTDLIKRIETGHLLTCDLSGYHSELTIIEGDKLEQLREYCWEMVSKYKNSSSEPRKIFINNLTGKLGEEVVKNRLGDLINVVNYEIYARGDGGIDLTLKNNKHLGIQVKTRTGNNINNIQWKITQKEIETNIGMVCIYSKQKVSEAQLHYHLILAGFIPTNMIKSQQNEVFLGIEDLYYGGGLKGYLESFI